MTLAPLPAYIVFPLSSYGSIFVNATPSTILNNMATLTVCSKANQATILPALLVASYANESDPNANITIKIEEVDKLPVGDNSTISLTPSTGEALFNSATIIQHLASSHTLLQAASSAQVNEWLSRLIAFVPNDFKSLEPALLELDSHLLSRSYVVGYSLTVADIAVWGVIRGNKLGYSNIKKGNILNLTRWYHFIEETNPWIASAVQKLGAGAAAKLAASSKKGASYDIDLKDTANGVVTRFPPEPSGYLHIGHAKAAMLNDYFAHEAYNGTMICRFDDTNPSKEKEEFQDAIVEDLALMGIRPDRTTYSSDYFEEMYQYCLKIIKAGNAYADDTDQETMGQERWNGIASKRRGTSPEENLVRFGEMKTGSEEGQKWCIRAKISVDDNNKAMRDPVIYRCNTTPHHRTGDTWKIYPTYDFCAPIVDSIEGVTHALRTNEYRDRNPQYDWMQKTLGLRSVHIWDFARMNFTRTLLSKRKLTKLVETGRVWGWDDPRFPTIRGIRRRGMTISALREFILKQGPSRNIVNLDWTLFWATNKKAIDPVSPRYVLIDADNAVKCTLNGVKDSPCTEEKPLHIKNSGLGTKKVVYSSNILIDQKDAKTFKQGEEITLMNWGNVIVRKISHSLNPLNDNITGLTLDLHLEGDFKTTEKKVTWLSTDGPELVKVEAVDFDFLITKDKFEEDDKLEDFLTEQTEFRTHGLADANVNQCQAGDIIQFERVGYYRVDEAAGAGKPLVVFKIPTGKTDKGVL